MLGPLVGNQRTDTTATMKEIPMGEVFSHGRKKKRKAVHKIITQGRRVVWRGCRITIEYISASRSGK